jgi:hypothetical protein
MRSRGFRLVLSMSLLGLIASCVPALASNIGVAPTPTGTARILFVHCEDAGVTGVALEAVRRGGDPPRPLWRIETGDPSPATIFTIGKTPVGFHEVVGLRGAFPPVRRLFAQVDTTAGPYGVSFRALDLEPGIVLRPDGAVPKASFADGACSAF